MEDVPEAFVGACERWASGRGTGLDEAAVAAVTLGVPLSLQYATSAASFGFDPSTRLPRDDDIDAYTAVRNAARGRAHDERGLASRAAVLRAATEGTAARDGLARASGTGAAAGARDLARAALSAHDAVWRCEPEELYPAGGATFVECMRWLGARVEVDTEAGSKVVFRMPPAPYMSAGKLLSMYWRTAAVCGDALPAGTLEQGLEINPIARRVAALLADATGVFGTCLKPRRRRRRTGKSG